MGAMSSCRCCGCHGLLLGAMELQGAAGAMGLWVQSRWVLWGCRCQGPRGASRVLGLELHLPGQELYVAFAGCLVRLPLSRCAQHGACHR